MFQLTDEEWKILRSQIAIFSKDTRKYKPYAFTEHGILMLSSVLNSGKAIDVNIQIMRIFTKMRQYLLSNLEPLEQVAELKKLLMLHIDNCDYKFIEYDEAIKYIMQVLDSFSDKLPTTGRIGFTVE